MAHPDTMFGWADLATPDLSSASAFYSAVLGWEAVEFPSPEGMPPYVFFMRDGRIAAGMGLLTDEQQAAGVLPAWSSYVAVDDVDDAVARALELGGEVMMPAVDVMQAGRMAFLIDPTGASFGLWQANEHKGADAFNEPGFMTWNELATRDGDRAIEFYTGLFGWNTDTRDHGGFVYTTFLRGDRPNGGVFDMTPYAPAEVPPHWAVYFAVDDTDEAVAVAERLGATVARQPTESEFGRMAVLLDPHGAMFEIITLTRIA